MMYEQQQQQPTRNTMESRKSIEEERLEIVDLSGMSLESLPTPSASLGAICSLNLSNNNLQVFSAAILAQILEILLH